MRSRAIHCETALLSVLLATSLAGPAVRAADLPDWAPKPPPLVIEDRFRADVLLLSAGLSTKLRLDSSLAQRGTLFSAEDDLGLADSQLLPMAEITLLPGERHLLRLSGLSTRRNAQAVVTRQIDFEDEVYLPGERVDSELNITLFGLTYGYRIPLQDRGEFAATIGLQIAQMEANAVVRSRAVRAAESGVAPLPFLGIEGRYDLAARWSVEARLQYLSADVASVKGRIVDTRIALTRRLNPHLLLGFGYGAFAIDVDSRNDHMPGRLDFDLGGPLAFVRASL